jgi:hypothetical protein
LIFEDVFKGEKETYQMLRDDFDTISTESSSASFRFDVAPQRNYQQRLLRAIQKMYEEVAVIVPTISTRKLRRQKVLLEDNFV